MNKLEESNNAYLTNYYVDDSVLKEKNHQIIEFINKMDLDIEYLKKFYFGGTLPNFIPNKEKLTELIIGDIL